MVNILLTGGTGFLGSRTLERLLIEEDVQTITLVSRKWKNLPVNPKIKILNWDLNNPPNAEQIRQIEKSNVVYHLASNVSLNLSKNQEELILKPNIQGTASLISILQNSNHLTHFFLCSSAYAGGNETHIPESWIFPKSFRNPYEKSKWLSEELTRQASSSGIPMILLRPSIIWSQGNEISGAKPLLLYGDLLNQALSDKTIRIQGREDSELNFIESRRVIEFMLDLRKQKPKKQVYNLTSTKSIPIQEILNIMAEGLGYKPGFQITSNERLVDLTRSERYINKKTRFLIPYFETGRITWESSINDNENQAFLDSIRKYCQSIKNEK